MSYFLHYLWFHHFILILYGVQYSQQHNNFLTSYLLLNPLSFVSVDPFLMSSDFLVFSLLIFLEHTAIFLHSLLFTSLFWPVFFTHYFLGGVTFTYFLTPLPLETLLLDALPLHIVFLHLHCFVVSYLSCACFILELAFECLLHHASKCNPYSVQSLCIHWLHIVNPIILPMNDRKSNFCFCIFPKCDACTCPYYHVSFPLILLNLLLSCFLRPVLLRNNVLNIFAGTLP